MLRIELHIFECLIKLAEVHLLQITIAVRAMWNILNGAIFVSTIISFVKCHDLGLHTGTAHEYTVMQRNHTTSAEII